MHRFPESTATTPEAAISALQEQLATIAEDAECYELWQTLSNAARLMAEAPEPDWGKIKALWLVADACSMMLRADKVNEPFAPFMVINGTRSAMPEDFSPEDAVLLSKVAEAVGHKTVRGRLSDIAWLCCRPKKNVADARRAIDAYTAIEPTEDNWFKVREQWKRAITLCVLIKQGAEQRLENIERVLERIADASLPLNGTLGLTVARILFERNLARDRGIRFAEALAKRGEELVAASGDMFHARAYLDLAAQWFTRLGNAERAADMTLSMGLSFETQTDQRIQADQAGGHLVGTALIEEAIQTLRKIPRELRKARDVEHHLDRLLKRLPESGELALKSMGQFSVAPVDVTELVRESEAAVSGQPPLQALLKLALLHRGARISAMTEYAQKTLREHPLSSMFAATHYGRDGRVVAKTIGADAEGAEGARDTQVWATIMRHYQIDIDFVAKASILPAMGILRMEHTIRRADLLQVLSQSSVVPPGRAEQFAHGLWAGLEHDFATAIYVLAPQVEHLVRWHLKQSGASTTNLDVHGIEIEVGLSSLMDAPQLKQIFGDDVAFELEALFCSPLGQNLRNEVAHGLLSADECNTTGVVYAWWWILRLTLASFLRSVQAVDPAPAGGRANGLHGPS